MNIEYLITLLQNRLSVLNNSRANAEQIGDISGLNNIDSEILQVQNTIEKLQTLLV